MGKPELKIVRTAALDWQKQVDHEPFVQRRKALGGGRISAGLWELPAGKKSFPFHAHHGTEEAMFVVAGTAKLRTPEGLTELSAGDYVSFPPGGPAHQLLNDGKEPFIYLGLSSSLGVDVVEYPDTGKVACAVGAPPDGKRFVFDGKAQVDYWEGEK